MRKLLKVLLPPFAGFSLYFFGVRYSPDYFNLSIGQIGTGTLLGFMAFYKYTLPLLFMVAFLTQLLIVIPIWNSVVNKSKVHKISAFVFLLFICFGFAFGMSYAIWDPQAGVHSLIVLVVFMAAVQLVYWLINLFILYLLE